MTRVTRISRMTGVSRMTRVTRMSRMTEVTRAGLEIATDTLANATNIIFFLATKNSSLVAKVATRFLYDLDLN